MMPKLRDEIIAVDDLTGRIREALLSAPELAGVCIRGELVGFKRHSSGHVYFTVTGKESRLSCVLFRSNAASVITWPRDGDEVLVCGRIDVYGAYGSYQLYATALMPLGEGARARAKDTLKVRLENEGIFDIRNKRPLPQFPSKIAVITSPTGAAIQDVIKVSSVRYPCAAIVLVPSLMQGAGAVDEIVRGFSRCAAMRDIDLVMLVRGGGSRDDLDVFDAEPVVRSVRSCPVPVITGLGHQIDSTLCDLAADACAPTPSGAAERVCPDKRELLLYIANIHHTMQRSLSLRIDRLLDDNHELMQRLLLCFERFALNPAYEFIQNADSTMYTNICHRIHEAETRLAHTASALQSASPLTILAKGYAVCTHEDGRAVRDAASLVNGERITIRLRDGAANATINSICAGENG